LGRKKKSQEDKQSVTRGKGSHSIDKGGGALVFISLGGKKTYWGNCNWGGEGKRPLITRGRKGKKIKVVLKKEGGENVRFQRGSQNGADGASIS